MQSIKFKGGFVQSLNPETKRLASKVGVIQSGVHSVKGSLDARISGRQSIGSKLAQAGSSLGRLEHKLSELNIFLNRSGDLYTHAETRVNKKAVSLIVSWNKNFGFEECIQPKNRTSDKDNDKVVGKKSSFDEILEYFGMVNEKVGFLDTVLLGSQLATIGTSLAIGRKLDIHYFNGKPSLWQKLKGGYKFSVGADASWTSKGKYSSKTARFLYEFAKSSPTNPIVKQLHKIMASYNNPSAILKHVAGFPKNANFMRATHLLETVHKRAEWGTKGAFRSVAEAKGFTKVGRGIPVVSTGITLVASFAELKSSLDSNKGFAESLGRAGSGLALDMAAIGTGAKAGAMIGSLGGPVGVIVGGAVGGFVGGAISVKWGDDIKNLGGQFGKYLGDQVSSKTSEWKKSISSWFN